MNPGEVRLVGKYNRVGLDRDVAVISSSVDMAGARATFHHYRERGLWRVLLSGNPDAPTQVFIERAFPRWRNAAKKSFLIPNQERFPMRHIGRLDWIDAVLTKTRHATEIFSRYHESVIYIGFTSPDRRADEVQKDWRQFLHVAGRSTVKRTDVILELWSRHPEWPTLHLVQSSENAPHTVPANVQLYAGYLDDHELQRLQNRCGVHLCPSLCEGWGHYIAEGLSCGAIVLTTDAPPMNELVTEERGRLVAWDRSEARHLGTCFFTTPAAIEESIEDLLCTSEERLVEVGDSARAWFQENDVRFRHEFPKILADFDVGAD
jgi:glycosyltransferase involved in cell wall biosynthesis